jgi:hypothetical protein
LSAFTALVGGKLVEAELFNLIFWEGTLVAHVVGVEAFAGFAELDLHDDEAAFSGFFLLFVFVTVIATATAPVSLVFIDFDAEDLVELVKAWNSPSKNEGNPAYLGDGITCTTNVHGVKSVLFTKKKLCCAGNASLDTST